MKRFFKPIAKNSPDKRIQTDDSSRVIQTKKCTSLEAPNTDDGTSKASPVDVSSQAAKIKKDGRNPSTFMTWNANSFLLRMKMDAHDFRKLVEQHDPDIIAIQVRMVAFCFTIINLYLTSCVTKQQGSYKM